MGTRGAKRAGSRGTTYATDNLARPVDDGDGLSYAHGGEMQDRTQRKNAARELCSGTFDSGRRT